MNISGIRTHAEFYDYNTIKNNEAKIQQIQQTKDKTDDAVELPAQKRESDFGATEYAKQYQPDVTYELKGSDSDIKQLDVERAISDMKKDQVLQQYQFFVGEKRAGEGLAELRESENFSL